MAAFEVSTESLDNMAATLRKESAKIEFALTTLEDAANKLKSEWDGAAREAYQHAHDIWTADFADMKQLLDVIATATEKYAAAYADGSKTASALFS